MERKKPQTEPVKDNSFGEESEKITKALTDQGFSSVIRNLLSGSEGRSVQMVAILDPVLADLKIKMTSNQLSNEAVKKKPEGSDQVDFGSIKTWAKSLSSRDKEANKQLRAIYATAKSKIS